MCGGAGGRERERETETERENERERERDRQTDRQTQTQTDRQTDRQRQTETERQRQTERERFLWMFSTTLCFSPVDTEERSADGQRGTSEWRVRRGPVPLPLGQRRHSRLGACRQRRAVPDGSRSHFDVGSGNDVTRLRAVGLTLTLVVVVTSLGSEQ